MRDIHAEYCMERDGISAEFFVCDVLRGEAVTELITKPQ